MIDWPKAAFWAATIALSIALWAGVVAVATAEPDPRTAQVQRVADETAAWLSATLRADVPTRPFVLTNDMAETSDAELRVGFGAPPHVHMRPYLATLLIERVPDTYVGTRRRGRFTALGPEVVIHETLHRADLVRCWGPQALGINFEEGLVSALTADLTPAWGWRFWRTKRLVGSVSYPAETAFVRAVAARATGSKTWRTRDARVWLRKAWGASCVERAAMFS